ncbi:PucR family transcriptional regulator [Isoptericola croceus]|uniref:PucR family transcriptional regulator n=1 Tax=Isoptericola croceus TaxID=3031406 RepID=UPI0023F9332C|nr:helix-turn-helix domain-containing protein [Isoptericola croceus]
MPDGTILVAPSRRSGAHQGSSWSRHRLVASLLDGTCLLADLRPASAALAMPVDGRYQVVALQGPGPAPLAAGRAAVSGPGSRVHWHSSRPVEHGIILVEPSAAGRPYPADPELPAELPPGVRMGVGMPVDGLASLADGRRQAETALRLCPPDGGTVHLATHLPAALLSADPALAGQLCDQVLGPLGPLVGPGRQVLLDTFAVWLATDGSTREAARRLGCHRNTVTNRLRRLEGLTGRRVDRPGDLVDLTLALHAHRAVHRPADGDLRAG